MALRWRGPVLREGTETGDRRLIEQGATRWRELPRDLGCIFEDGFGHENAVVVGIIESLERVGDDIIGDGPVLLGNEDADRWVNMNRQGAMHGCSVDITGGECIVEVVHRDTGEVLDPEVGIEVLWGPEGDDYYVRERWTDAEIGSVAVCRVPAFAEALIEVYDTDEPAGDTEADPDVELAGAAATFATIDEVSIGDRVQWTEEDGDDTETRTGTITAIDEELETVTVDMDGDDGEPSGDEVVIAVAEVTVIDAESDDDDEGEGDEAAFPELARRSVAAAGPRPALAAMLARQRGEPVQASLVAGHHTGSELIVPGAVVQAAVSWGRGPSRDAFARRQFDRPMPFTIDDDGTVYGHLRTRGQCHMGFMGGAFNRCVTVPDSPTDYALFHANRQVRCDDGSRMAVGIIALDSGHAPAGRPGRRPSLASTQRWYEDTGLQACYVHAYDDEFGTQVCGILRDGLAVDDARRAMASSPSGDWRDYGQGLDLTGVAFVSVPGYPQYEVEDSGVIVLTACLAPPPGVELIVASADANGDNELASGGCSGGCGCGGTCAAGQAGNLEQQHQHRLGDAMRASQRMRLAAIDGAFAGAAAGGSTTATAG